MQPTVAHATNESVQGAVVEGLFVRALKASGDFADDLRAVGVDVGRLTSTYPVPVYMAALKVAHKHVCPELSEEAAQRELGRRFTAGFLDTILGSVMGGAATLRGPVAFVKRLPKSLTLGRDDVVAEAIEEGPTRWRVRSSHPTGTPHFVAGSVEAMFRRMKVDARIEVLKQGPTGYELSIAW